MANFDCIVLGLGAMGSAAADHLTRRGLRVLGLDAHARGHQLGASHGKSRFIREAYFEKPDYVTLVRRAYGQWRDLEARSGSNLIEITGGLWMGPLDSPIVAGARLSAERHGLPHELLSAAGIRHRYPEFQVSDETWGLLEPNAGVLKPEECVRAQLEQAERAGARLRFGERVLRWSADGAGVAVETDQMRFTADRLVIAAGPWSAKVLADLALPMEAHRVYYLHCEPAEPTRFARSPLWLIDWAPGVYYYGVPYRASEGVKFGLHRAAMACDPDTVERAVSDEEAAEFRAAMERILPGSATRLLWAESCLYAMTPDTDFILDRHPRHPQVVFGCGFSGHGFKFAPVIGEALADLAMEGRSALPIEFLRLARI
ncbi:MAG: N-methyl-L-tryptophan oxidase [Bryobacteraceae bacterium]|nr:N-methyl-L-tryptophan oxidase [Bryobacteraceae bacterium]